MHDSGHQLQPYFVSYLYGKQCGQKDGEQGQKQLARNGMISVKRPKAKKWLKSAG